MEPGEEDGEEHGNDEPDGDLMTSHVLTLIGNARSIPLQSDHIERVYQRLGLPDGETGKVDWLAEREACDLCFESPLSAADITDHARNALSGAAIDAVCTPSEGRRRKLLVSDMDSTVIDQECIDELGDAIGHGSEIKQITAAVLRGDIGFADALRQRLAMLKGVERRFLETLYEERISLKAGARTLIQTMRHDGAFCVLVSGGFTFFTRRVAERIGFDDHRGNELLFEDGKLTGEVREPILGRSAKLNTLNELCEEKGLQPSHVLAIGDGANDIKMIEAAGLGVAFHASDSLKKQANACIDHGDLTALLYIQGYRKSEFVLS